MANGIQVIDHPLVATRLSVMRDKRTDNAGFRASLSELTTLLVYEALRETPTRIDLIDTPVAPTEGVALAGNLIFVPILRAGLGMLDSATKLVPTADIGFVGMARNEETHEPASYMESLPSDLGSHHVVVLDPMLATGGSLISCIESLRARGTKDVTVICVLAAPEGLARVSEYDPTLRIVTASIDERLNENAYIVPGLGDAGDRQFGAV